MHLNARIAGLTILTFASFAAFGAAEVVAFPSHKVRKTCQARLDSGRVADTLKFAPSTPEYESLPEFLRAAARDETARVLFTAAEPPAFTRRDPGVWSLRSFVPDGDRLYMMRVRDCGPMTSMMTISKVREICAPVAYSFVRVPKVWRDLAEMIRRIRLNERIWMGPPLGTVHIEAESLWRQADLRHRLKDYISSWRAETGYEWAIKQAWINELERAPERELQFRHEALMDRLVGLAEEQFRGSWKNTDSVDPRY